MPPLPSPSRTKPAPMPKFMPAAPETVVIFESAIDGHPAIEKRKMFGYPCAFLQGQMLFGVFADRLVLRLSDADRAEFLQLPDARVFEPTPGRTMREYVELPPAMMNSGDELQDWLRRGIAYTQTLPPKLKKSPKAKPGGPKASTTKSSTKPKLGSKPKATAPAKPTAKTKAKLGSKPKATLSTKAKTTAKLGTKATPKPKPAAKPKAKLGTKQKKTTK